MIKVLFVVLVLCALALFGAVVAGFIRVRLHMRKPGSPEPPAVPDATRDEQSNS
jgi:hypothetical protein